MIHVLFHGGSTTGPTIALPMAVTTSIASLFSVKQWRGLGGSAILTNHDPHLLARDGTKIPLAVNSANDHVLELFPLRPALASPLAVADIAPSATSVAANALATDSADTIASADVAIDSADAVAPDATLATDSDPALTPALDISRSLSPALMPGLTLDGDRAHQIFAHAAPARLDRILSHYGLPSVGPACRLHCCIFGRARRAPTHSVSQHRALCLVRTNSRLVSDTTPSTSSPVTAEIDLQ